MTDMKVVPDGKVGYDFIILSMFKVNVSLSAKAAWVQYGYGLSANAVSRLSVSGPVCGLVWAFVRLRLVLRALRDIEAIIMKLHWNLKSLAQGGTVYEFLVEGHGSLSRTFSNHGKMKASFLLLIWLNEKAILFLYILLDRNTYDICL